MLLMELLTRGLANTQAEAEALIVGGQVYVDANGMIRVIGSSAAIQNNVRDEVYDMLPLYAAEVPSAEQARERAKLVKPDSTQHSAKVIKHLRKVASKSTVGIDPDQAVEAAGQTVGKATEKLNAPQPKPATAGAISSPDLPEDEVFDGHHKEADKPAERNPPGRKRETSAALSSKDALPAEPESPRDAKDAARVNRMSPPKGRIPNIKAEKPEPRVPTPTQTRTGDPAKPRIHKPGSKVETGTKAHEAMPGTLTGGENPSRERQK